MNQRPQPVTRLTACALILLVVSGCSLFGSAESFSSLLQANALSPAVSETAVEPEPAATESDAGTHFEQFLSESDDLLEPDDVSEAPVAPSGRLLSPEFPESAWQSGGHSLGIEGESGGESLSPTVIRPVSQTRELFEPPGQPGTAENSPRSVNSMERTVDNMSAASPLRSDQDTAVAAQPVSVETRVAEAPQQTVNPSQPERSMLERLRGFAPDRRTGNLLRRQIERIPSPWDLLPGRETTEDTPPQTPAPTAATERTPPPAPIDIDFSTADTAELLQALIETLERELETWPQTESGLALQPDEYRRRQLNLRLLHLIDDQPAAAAEAIDLMSPEEQEFWQELILGISQFRNPDEHADYEQHIAETIGQLRQAVQQLEPLSSLRIRRLDFCTSIEHFGAIETFPSNTFEPAQRLLVYAEVENLQSDVSPAPLNSYRTSFTGQLEIWPIEDSDAEQFVESWPIDTVHEDSSTRRSDYFLSCEFTLPPHIKPGKYELRLQVRDDISGRTAVSHLEFVVQ